MEGKKREREREEAGEWFQLSEAYYIYVGLPKSSGNLPIKKIAYHNS
jgi:hypothetical protein